MSLCTIKVFMVSCLACICFTVPFKFINRLLVNFVNCYAGDLNETYFVGNVDEESRQLVKCTYECLEKAISIGIYPIWFQFWNFCVLFKFQI